MPLAFIVKQSNEASVSSDRRAQKDSQFEVTSAGTVSPGDVRQLGSNPVVPTLFPHKSIVVFGGGLLLGITAFHVSQRRFKPWSVRGGDSLPC
jgi:hypothetical protein